MSDILERAKALCNYTVTAVLEREPEICLDSARMLPELITECERLQETLKTIYAELEHERASVKSWQEAASEQKRYCLAANVEAAKWRQKAIEEHAARLYYESLPCTSDEYSWHDYPEEPCHCKKKSTYREQAERELEAMK